VLKQKTNKSSNFFKYKIVFVYSVSFIFLSLFLFSQTTFAKLEDEGCSLGEWDNDTPVSNFELNLSDPTNKITELSITNNNNDIIPVNAIDMYDGAGVPIKLDFAAKDKENNDYFLSINGIYSGSNDYAKSYGDAYEVIYTDANKINLLPGSHINLVENDSFLTGGDDPINLTLQTLGNNSTMVWEVDADGDYGLGHPPDGTNWDDLDWDTKTVFDMIDIEIRLSIPLKIKGNSNTTLEKKVTALIQVTPSGIIFDNGLSEGRTQVLNLPSIDALLKSYTRIYNNDNTEYKVIEKKAIGKNAPGLRTPGRAVYNGMSGEKSLDKFLVGITNFFLSFVAGVAVLMLIYGGYLWLIDRGEDQMAEKARKIIASAVIGLLIIISSYSIIRTVIVFGTDYDKCELATRLGHTSEINLFCKTGDNEFSIGMGFGGVMDWLLGG